MCIIIVIIQPRNVKKTLFCEVPKVIVKGKAKKIVYVENFHISRLKMK